MTDMEKERNMWRARAQLAEAVIDSALCTPHIPGENVPRVPLNVDRADLHAYAATHADEKCLRLLSAAMTSNG